MYLALDLVGPVHSLGWVGLDRVRIVRHLERVDRKEFNRNVFEDLSPPALHVIHTHFDSSWGTPLWYNCKQGGSYHMLDSLLTRRLT